MNYIEVTLNCNPNTEIVNAILANELGKIGYDSFAEHDHGTLAYIADNLFDEQKLKEALSNFPLDAEITYTHKELENKNWNEEWEKNYFSPIIIDDRCVVKSTFHKDVPDCEYTIIINPKMAFGTGHHQTTGLMLGEILKTDFTGQSVLDMGCGTAILAILASMRGAKNVLAIDIDEWAYDNAQECLELNDIENVVVKIGGAELLKGYKFDTVIANINRNVLLDDMHTYADVMKNEGTLYLSGFYTEDIPLLEEEANKHYLFLEYHTSKDNWAGVKFKMKRQ